MKKIVLATAALALTAGGAFAQTSFVNSNIADRPALQENGPVVDIDYGTTASVQTTPSIVDNTDNGPHNRYGDGGAYISGQ